MEILLVLSLKSQGQLAGFVVDEAHCVRYASCFLYTIVVILFYLSITAIVRNFREITLPLIIPSWSSTSQCVSYIWLNDHPVWTNLTTIGVPLFIKCHFELSFHGGHKEGWSIENGCLGYGNTPWIWREHKIEGRNLGYLVEVLEMKLP